MRKAKGSILVYIQKAMEARGPEFEKHFLNQLNEEDRIIYIRALPVSWIDIDATTRICEIASQELYPGDSQPMVKLGHDEAVNDFQSVYKIILRLTTVKFVVKQTSRLWSTYHDTGYTTYDIPSGQPNTIRFVIRDYPSLPKGFRDHLIGDVQGIAELTGAANIQIIPDYSNPQSWQYTISWK